MFWSDYSSSLSDTSNWETRIKTQEYVNDLKRSYNRGADRVESAIQRQSELIQHSTSAQIQATAMATEVVAKNLQAGFKQLHSDLNVIADNQTVIAKAMGQLLGYTEVLIDEAKRSNEYLQNIIQRLAIPDAQKQREYKIGEGYKHLHNAVQYPDRFDDALRNFQQALEIEPADYFTLYRLGLVYFFSPIHVSLTKAEDHFRKAAEYALAEVGGDARRSQTALGEDIGIDRLKEHAGDALSMQARCHFLLGDKQKALDICTLAVAHFPERLDIHFEKARLEVSLSQGGVAGATVQTMLDTELKTCILIAADPTLASCKEVVETLEREREKHYRPVKTAYDRAEKIMIKGSQVMSAMQTIGLLLKQHTILDSFRASQIANEEDIFEISYTVTQDHSDWQEATQAAYNDFKEEFRADFRKGYQLRVAYEITTFIKNLNGGPIPYSREMVTTPFQVVKQEHEGFLHMEKAKQNIDNAWQVGFTAVKKFLQDSVKKSNRSAVMWNPVAGLIVFFLWYWILEFFRWITGWDTIINILFYGPLVIAIYYYVKNALLPTLNPNQNSSNTDEMLKAVMRPSMGNTDDAKEDTKPAKETKRLAVVTRNPRSLDGLKEALQSSGYRTEIFRGTIHYIDPVKALKPEIILFYIEKDRPDAPIERAITSAGQYLSELFRQDWIKNIPVVVFSPNEKAREHLSQWNYDNLSFEQFSGSNYEVYIKHLDDHFYEKKKAALKSMS